MSQHDKPGPPNPSQPAFFEMPPAGVHPKDRERVAQLIASKKSEKALDAAKDIHKRFHTSASEALLLDAYGARLESLIERKLDREAMDLMKLVRERYPSAGERLREWEAFFAARHGDLSALLSPLNDAALPAEKQAAIAARVRRDVLDLGSLAVCAALAPDHPLRIAAGALGRAFIAVTSGPVAEDAIALPEVSRSSPLAPWKMLVRAIAAYYRGDDVLCEKSIAAIEPDSAAARLAPPLLKLIHKPQTLTAAATALVNQVDGNFDLLHTSLKRLDAALIRRDQQNGLLEIRNAMAAAGGAEPGLLERLKQHISIRAMVGGLKPDKVSAALGGPSLRNAYFWRLLARAHELDKAEPLSIACACSAWEEFRKHAIRQGLLPAQGPEAAVVYLHMVDLLRPLGDDDLGELRNRFRYQFDGHAGYYQGQPAEIRALMPSRGNLDFLDPGVLLDRACGVDPCRENFARAMQYAAGQAPAIGDAVAERWSAALPNDSAPLLHLMQSAEKRNALGKAFKYMERADQIDGLNPEVRRARLRLLVSMAVRHLREKKPKLAEKELRQIEALPQAQQGDRPAFVAALKFVWHLLRNENQLAQSVSDEAGRFLGDAVTAHVLFLHVEEWCGRPASSLGNSPKPTVPLIEAMGRVCALGDDMGMQVELTSGVPDQLMRDLSAPRVSADPRFLTAIGEAAIRQDYYPLAYLAAGAGLAQGSEGHARFLFLRARAMPPWTEDRRASCLAAASELARRHHDTDLLRRIGEWRHEELDWLDVPEQASAAPGTDEIARVVAYEIREKALPAPPTESPSDDNDDEECDCPACCAKRGELPPELIDMMEELGPEAVMKALGEMIGIGGGRKKRKRRRSTLDDMDVPF